MDLPMSEDQLQAFVAALKSSTELQSKVKSAASVDDVLAIAKDAGFAIQAEELRLIQQISDEELESVAGGTIWTVVTPLIVLPLGEVVGISFGMMHGNCGPDERDLDSGDPTYCSTARSTKCQ